MLIVMFAASLAPVDAKIGTASLAAKTVSCVACFAESTKTLVLL